MEDYDVRSASSILASVKEQEARFEQLTRALEEERRNVTLQLERANLPPNPATSQPLAWQQLVMQVKDTTINHLVLPCGSFSGIHGPCSLFPLEQELISSLFAHSRYFGWLLGFYDPCLITLWFGTLVQMPEPTSLNVVQSSGIWWLIVKSEIQPLTLSPFTFSSYCLASCLICFSQPVSEIVCIWCGFSFSSC